MDKAERAILEKALENASKKAYIETKERYGYDAILYKRKLSEMGAYRAAIELIQTLSYSSGFTKVATEFKRPDLTIEAIVLSGPWKSLFPESILDAARKKLKSIHYTAPEYKEYESEAETREWSDMELDASVSAYLEMLKHERKGEEYNKAEFNRHLREYALKKRSKSSVELRMQNISAVLDELGLDWIEGYKPKINVGEQVKDRIKEILRRKDLEKELSEPTSSEEHLNKRTKELSKTDLEKPEGNKTPKKTTITSTA